MRSNTDISQSGESQHPWVRIYAQGMDAVKSLDYGGMADLDTALAETDLAILVLYVAPVAVVAEALAQGASAAGAVAGWSGQCEDFMAVQRKYRHQMVVIEQPQTDSARQAAEAALADRVPGMALPEAAFLTGTGAQSSMYQALAGLALGQDEQALAQVDGLQAASLGFYDDLPAGQTLTETLLAGQREMLRQQQSETERSEQRDQSEAALASAVQQAKQGTAVLAKQVVALEAQIVAQRAVAAERDAQKAKAGTFEKRAEDLSGRLQAVVGERDGQKARVEALEKRAGDLSGRLQAAVGERDAQKTKVGSFETRVADQKLAAKRMEAAMIKQIAGLEQALVALQAEHSQSQTERRQIDSSYRQKLAELTGQLDAVHGSTTWRVMGPARSVMRRIRR